MCMFIYITLYTFSVKPCFYFFRGTFETFYKVYMKSLIKEHRVNKAFNKCQTQFMKFSHIRHSASNLNFCILIIALFCITFPNVADLYLLYLKVSNYFNYLKAFSKLNFCIRKLLKMITPSNNVNEKNQ